MVNQHKARWAARRAEALERQAMDLGAQRGGDWREHQRSRDGATRLRNEAARFRQIASRHRRIA